MEERTPSSAEDTAASSAAARRFDPVTFVGGLVCVFVALVALTDRIQLSATDVQWLGPLLLVGFGIVLVASAAGPRNLRDGVEPDVD